ncbi:neuronal acetylcholine receptor subunit alpha-10-like [Tachypleus tridentatus]|uniref:neuronal acetylcholine receptor subunit alpha-10-like n=1 Tax=Tachypleus tridentatus TaxID=6853 RepID=UPI003FD5B3AC
MSTSVLHVIAVALLFEYVNQTVADEQEYRLTRYLMSNYDLAVRPSHNSSLPLRLTFDLSLHQVIDLDEKNHVLTTSCWITQRWTDYHLRWNITDFNGIPVIRVPASQVWRPDILLFNNADTEKPPDNLNTNVIVKYTGEVIWFSRALLRSSCPIDIKYFPFDVQFCTMRFASGTYDGLQVELMKEKDHIELRDYQENGEFDLNGFSATSTALQHSCCEEPYPQLVYTLELRRRPLYYVFNLILPCLLMNCVALLTFCMPCESGEKVTLSICTLLTIVIFFVFVKDTLPPSQETPLISLYYVVTICLVALVTIFSVFTLHVHHRGNFENEIPRCIRKVMLGFLAKIMFSKCSSHTEQEPELKLEDDEKKSNLERQSSNEDKFDFGHIEQYNFSPRLRKRKEMGEASDYSNDEYKRQVLRILGKIYETVERNEMRVAEKARKENIKTEWHQTSLVCDRLWLALFLIVSTVMTLLVLLSSPHGP